MAVLVRDEDNLLGLVLQTFSVIFIAIAMKGYGRKGEISHARSVTTITVDVAFLLIGVEVYVVRILIPPMAVFSALRAPKASFVLGNTRELGV